MPLHVLNWSEPYPESCRGGVVTIGNFDGVHLGHHSLLAEARLLADRLGGPVVALSFDPHPLQLLRPESFEPLLATPQDRAALLHQHGAEQVIFLRTSEHMLRLPARTFFDQVVRDRLDARAVVEGSNFRFGRGREGDAETLAQYCRQTGLRMTIVPPVDYEGKPVSSSRVRRILLAGDVCAAAAMLGRPHRLRGIVRTGQQRGATLGFPTANLEAIPTLIPGNGVYAAWVSLEAPEIVRQNEQPEERKGAQFHSPDLSISASGPLSRYPGAVNIGPNPTFGEDARKVEVHLLDWNGDLINRNLTLDFLERLRDTQAFASKDQLIEQLQRDVASVRAFCARSEIMEERHPQA
jgi:riboflavin kinase/FMN adenylyltransferase